MAANTKELNSKYYEDITNQLLIAANHYNNPCGEEIYFGYIELIKLIECLSGMYNQTELPKLEILELKNLIKQEYECLINNLEYQFQSFPDEITNNNILNGKMIIGAFRTYENN